MIHFVVEINILYVETSSPLSMKISIHFRHKVDCNAIVLRLSSFVHLTLHRREQSADQCLSRATYWNDFLPNQPCLVFPSSSLRVASSLRYCSGNRMGDAICSFIFLSAALMIFSLLVRSATNHRCVSM